VRKKHLTKLKTFTKKVILILLILVAFFPAVYATPVGTNDEDTNGSPSEIQDKLKLSEDLLNKDTEKSLKLAVDVLEMATKKMDGPSMIKAERIMGDNYVNQANFSEGFKYLIMAIDLAEKNNDQVNKANVLNSLGQFYMALDQYPKSISYFKQAVTLSEEKNLKNLHSLVISNLASAYQHFGDNNEAEKLLLSSPNKNNVANAAFDYLTLGNIAKTRKKYDEALLNYNKAYANYEVVKDNKGELNTLMDIGKTYLEMDNGDKAELCFKDVLTKSRDLKYSNLEMQCYKELADVYNLTGQFLRATENYKKFVKFKDSTESLSKIMTITQLNSHQILEAKQRNIEELISQRDRIEAFNKLRNILFLVLAISLPIILISLIRVWIADKQKKKINEQLSKKKEELENLNVVKDRLFSIIGHDLRSPLANLEAILKLMDSGDLGLEEVLHLANKLTNDVQETSIMLENLLHWSNSQMKGVPPKFEQVELYKIAKDTFTFLRPQSEKKSISLKIDQIHPCITFGDKEMVRLVLRNLVANAIKFTPNEGRIIIQIDQKDNEALVSVIDSGIGINETNLKKIFSNQPITTRGTQNEKGTGLGLMLCKDFVEKNNGKIWVTSEVGKGTVFSFTLPLNSIKEEVKPILEEPVQA